MNRLPVELTVIVFKYASSCPHEKRIINRQSSCMCSQLELLKIAMVCSSWHSIATIMMTSWPLLVNYPGIQRNYPYRSQISQLLQESKRLNLDFHRHINQLVLDFASIDLKDDNNINNASQLLNICPDIEKLLIIYDTKFASLVSRGTMLQEKIALISKTLNSNSKTSSITSSRREEKRRRIRQLELVGHNPEMRCPCCSGKKWDYLLVQLLDHLDIDELILGCVVPSPDVYYGLSKQKNLSAIVFKRSIMTISSKTTTKPLYTSSSSSSSSNNSETSIGRVPKQIWSQINRIEIYEDIEDRTIWRSRFLDELIDNVKSLRQLVIHFGTPEENEKMANCRGLVSIGSTTISGSSEFELALSRLISKCKDSLEWILLVNVPNIKSGYVHVHNT